MPDEATHEVPVLDPELRRMFDAQRDRRIFVELASVRAGEIVATISSAIGHAARPDQLRFGIAVREGDDDGDRLLRGRRDDPRCSIEFHPPTDQAGHQWRRHRAQSFYDGEPFTLQVDGEARFSPDWDVRYPELLSAADVERPLATTTPLPRSRPGATAPARPSGALEQLAPHRFTIGRFAIDVPHDSEERGDDDIRLAVRAYTHGYDAVFPAVPLVVRADEERPPSGGDDHDRTLATVVASLARSSVGATAGLGIRRTVAALDRLMQQR